MTGAEERLGRRLSGHDLFIPSGVSRPRPLPVFPPPLHHVSDGTAQTGRYPIRRNGLITENAEQQFSDIAMAGNSC